MREEDSLKKLIPCEYVDEVETQKQIKKLLHKIKVCIPEMIGIVNRFTWMPVEENIRTLATDGEYIFFNENEIISQGMHSDQQKNIEDFLHIIMHGISGDFWKETGENVEDNWKALDKAVDQKLEKYYGAVSYHWSARDDWKAQLMYRKNSREERRDNHNLWNQEKLSSTGVREMWNQIAEAWVDGLMYRSVCSITSDSENTIHNWDVETIWDAEGINENFLNYMVYKSKEEVYQILILLEGKLAVESDHMKKFQLHLDNVIEVLNLIDERKQKRKQKRNEMSNYGEHFFYSINRNAFIVKALLRIKDPLYIEMCEKYIG